MILGAAGRKERLADSLDAAGQIAVAGCRFGGAAQLNIVIRTIVSTPNGISIGTGGAIVSMSDPDAEVTEIVLKTRALTDVLTAAGAAATDPVPPDVHVPPSAPDAATDIPAQDDTPSD